MSYQEPFMQTVLQISISTAAVIGFLLLLLPLWQQRYSARWRKIIWLVIAIRLLIPLSVELPEAPVQINMDLQRVAVIQSQPDRWEQTDLLGESVNNPSITAPFSDHSANEITQESSKSITIWNHAMLLFYVWCFGMIIFLLYQGVQYSVFRHRVMKSVQPFEDGSWLLHQAGDGLNLHRYPDVMRNSWIQSPMLTGFIKPVILLPHKNYEPQELLLILRHELTHYKHHDLWYKLILLTANAMHWFNPLVYLMVRQAGRDVEQVCDSFVVAGKDMAYRKAYSMTILNTMANQRGVTLSTYLSKDAQNTRKRFAGILQPKQYKRGAVVFLGIVLLAVAASGCLQFAKPVEGDEYLERIEAYLPEGLEFGDRLEYKHYDSEEGIVHQWTDYADKTPQNVAGIEGKVDETCFTMMILDNDDNLIRYTMEYDSGYHVQEQLPENPLSDVEAKQLAERFVQEFSGETGLRFETWEPPASGRYRIDNLLESETGWIADSAEKGYHYEIIVNTKYGHIQHFYKFYDDENLRKQVSDWLLAEAREIFSPYPHIVNITLVDIFSNSRKEDNQYWLYVPLRVYYNNVAQENRNPDSIWGMQSVDENDAELLNFGLPIQICVPIKTDGTPNFEKRQMYMQDLNENGDAFFREITGFEVFIGQSHNAMAGTSGWDQNLIRTAEIFANMLARVTSAESKIARDRIDNNPVIQNMTLPEYAYLPESSVTVPSLRTDFFRRYGQFGNDGESYEPVALSAEMEKKDGTTDTLTMWLITEDGKWKVADAELEPSAKSDESVSFWEYTGYLDAFPWENTQDTAPFAYDYDGDEKIDRVHRSEAPAEGYYQYQIEFASGDVLKIEKPVSNVGYPQIDGADLTGDGQNEIIFQVGYPTSTNPLAFGELVVYEKQKNGYQPMRLPFEDGDEPYQQMLPVTYSKADGQAVKVSVPGTDFTQVVPIEDDALWNGYQYGSIYTRGETIQHCIWAYKIRDVGGKSQLICSIQLFDKWSEWGLDIALDYENNELTIGKIEFCEDIYTEWM